MGKSAATIQKRFEWPLVVAALLVLPTIVIEESNLGQPWTAIGTALNWGIWLAFLAEVVTMLVVVEKRWDWIRSHPLDVAIVILTPPFAPVGAQVLRLLRLLRLTRVLKVAQLLSLQGIRLAALVAVSIVIGGGIAFSAIESDQQLTSWDGIWWAVTTVTTVGYGDISPATDAGRIIAISIMGVGIGFVAIVTAFAAERFIRVDSEDESHSMEQVLVELRRLHERLDRLERRI